MTGKTDFVSDFNGLALLLDGIFAAGKDRCPGLLGHPPAGNLVAQKRHGLRTGPDELDMAIPTHGCELGTLGQEAVARVNRVRLGGFGGGDDSIDPQVGIKWSRWPDADSMVGLIQPWAVTIGFRVHADGLEPELAGCADDPQSNFASVGDENSREHAVGSVVSWA